MVSTLKLKPDATTECKIEYTAAIAYQLMPVSGCLMSAACIDSPRPV